jgi:hypothetical protein
MQNISPLTKVSDTEFIEGYWKCDYNNSYPMPVDSGQLVDEKFLKKLSEVTEKYADTFACQGYSECRLCGKHNGFKEYRLTNKAGITFNYPDGLTHYYTEHRVQPSKEFVVFVMDFQQ